MASKPKATPIEIVSTDPEIMALQTLIRGLRHFGAKPNLTFRHFKVMAGVDLACRILKRNVMISEVEGLIGLKRREFESHLLELVELRYLHEVHATYGDHEPRYKLGSMGGTAVRTMFKHFHTVETKVSQNV